MVTLRCPFCRHFPSEGGCALQEESSTRCGRDKQTKVIIYNRRHPDPHTANPHRVVDPPWCPPTPLQNMPGTTAFARHSLVSIALRIVLPLCLFEANCIANCEARPPHSKVQPPQNPSTATFRNRENQNGPLGTAMILMGPTGVNIGQFLSISVNIGQFLSISVNSGRSTF